MYDFCFAFSYKLILTIPFFIYKSKKRQYAILPWDFTSIYYGWKEISENNLQLYEKFPDELRIFEKSFRELYKEFPKESRKTYEKTQKKHKTGEILNLDSLDWKDIEQ